MEIDLNNHESFTIHHRGIYIEVDAVTVGIRITVPREAQVDERNNPYTRDFVIRKKVE